MASNLQTLVRRHLESIAEFPDSLLARNAPEALSIKNIPLKDFDSRITGVAGGSSPPFPFATANDYYVWASTHELLDDVRVPFLTMNADDDPIVVEVPVDSFTNSWVAMVVTRGGGHLGWFEQVGWSFEVKRWMSKPVIEWLGACGEGLAIEHRREPPSFDADGWLVERDRSDLGCKEIGEGGRVEGAEGQEGMIAGL
ncbi:hypothetical protein EWM64_g3000 [Hericium alpestre]|uniref:Uncharacterized protein n=1 Tax=Hericium alpestre TaxID=135208 RepID=A0A4Z0A1S7_9AGAM|nr:hypothetical protein EWM64_g3000 [Hericium alpestre]